MSLLFENPPGLAEFLLFQNFLNIYDIENTYFHIKEMYKLKCN